MQAFSSDWAAAYLSAINANSEYAKSSGNWTHGALAFALTDGSAVLLDLHQGVCRGAMSVSIAAALEQAAFVIEGDAAAWQEVLGGKTAPLMALMRGKLKLSKGSIAKLMPFTKAASELVASAQTLPTEFA